MQYKYEKECLDILKKRKSCSLEEIAEALNVKKDALMRPVLSLESKGLISKTEEVKERYIFSEEGLKYSSSFLPEVELYFKAKEKPINISTLNESERFQIKWAKKHGFISIENGLIKPSAPEEKVREYQEKFASSIEKGDVSEEFLKRGLIVKKTIKSTTLSITEKGLSTQLEEEGISVLTTKMLEDGSWRNKELKSFDVSVEGKDEEIGKVHPITAAIRKIKRIFAEMGFEEVEGNFVESAFWNFDALFQPQDHPARELADTFYVEGVSALPEEFKDKVKEVHEKGWHYKWDEEEAKKQVLRTHTTAVSARALAKLKKGPKKYFSIGRVFRNEATDFKHLAEFHQIEGIVVWEKATFSDLLGILVEFYKKLGFEKIRFRPSFFPYTEPSVEIEVYFENKKQWVEIGGAGVFRPEVSEGLSAPYPVLAFGLSLERPLMMMLGIEDIRAFYRNDLDYLRKRKVEI